MKGITLLYDESMTEIVKETIIPLFAQHLKIATPFKNERNLYLENEEFIVTYLSVLINILNISPYLTKKLLKLFSGWISRL